MGRVCGGESQGVGSGGVGGAKESGRQGVGEGWDGVGSLPPSRLLGGSPAGRG